jgi:hypothetical protein
MHNQPSLCRQLLYCLSFAAISIASHAQDILWEKSYGGKHADYLFDAIPTADYGFILAGSSLSEKTGNKTEAGRGDLDYWIWKMDEKGDLDWQKSFGGIGSDLLKSIKLTNDGGFILAGTSDSPKGSDKKEDSKGKNDFWIIKLDASGGEQWQKTIGGFGQDDISVVIQTKDNGYLLGGSSSSPKSGDKSDDSRGNMDYWLVKLSSTGTIEWQHTFGGQYIDELRGLEQTKDGGYIVGGYSNSSDTGEKTDKNYGVGDYWVLKLDDKGAIVWQKTFGGDKDDHLYAIHQTIDGGYILGGNSNSGASNNKKKGSEKGTDFWVIKLNEDGQSVWQETYNIGQVDILTSIAENSDGTFLVAGYAKTEVVGKKTDKKEINDYIALKIDGNGDEKWRRAIGSSGEDVLHRLIETRDGGYLLAGTSKGQSSRDRSSNIGRNDFWVVKLKDKEKPKEKAKPVEAFPNPTDGYTNIIVGYEYKKGWATLYDLSGHQLQRFKITDRTIPINLSSLPEGVYIVQIGTDESTDSVKIIKGISKN